MLDPEEPAHHWAGVAHHQTLARTGGYVAWVDAGLVGLIEALWAAGVHTWVSCEGGPTPTGHIYEPYIGLLSPWFDVTRDLAAAHGWEIIDKGYRPSMDDFIVNLERV